MLQQEWRQRTHPANPVPQYTVWWLERHALTSGAYLSLRMAVQALLSAGATSPFSCSLILFIIGVLYTIFM